MKFVYVLAALVAVAHAQRNLCRSNCQSTDVFNDGTNAGCQCDDACVNADDCCGSYFEFCADDIGCVGNCGSDGQYSDADGRCFCDEACGDAEDCCDNYATECDGETEDTACQGCPDGAQTATSGSTRGSCYCDAECVDSGDCCPSFTKYCGDAIVADDRARFCAILSTSKSVFCDTAMRKAYYFEIVSKINTTFADKQSYEWREDTYKRTCFEPEVVEEDAETCFNSPTGYNWRYGCSGLNTVFAQHCESNSCRDRECDAPWRRDFWGPSSKVRQYMDPDPEERNPLYPEFPRYFFGWDTDKKSSQAGRCQMLFEDKCVEGALPADANRAKFRTYGCLDDTYDADDVEFLDWEEAFKLDAFSGSGPSYFPPIGNGDSATRKYYEFQQVFELLEGPTDLGDWGHSGQNDITCS